MSEATLTAFEHLFDQQKAANLKARSDLMNRLTDHIEKHGLTREEAAENLGTTPERINDLLSGKISRFTVSVLANMCSAADGS